MSDFSLSDDEPIQDETDGMEEALDEEALPEIFSYSEDEGNLVNTFMAHPDGVEALKEIADHCHSQFSSAFEATEAYRKRMADNIRIFTGDLPEKEDGFEDSANAHLPVMLETITRLAFRVYGELFEDQWHVFDYVPVGPDDDANATVLSVHGNWQIREQIRDFPRQMHRLTLGFFLIGDIVVSSYYDELRKVNCHEVLTPDQFVKPYSVSTTRPDLSDLPWYAKIIQMYSHELEARREVWSEVDRVLEQEPPGWDAEPEQPIADTIAQIQDIEKDESDKNTPYKIIQWEGWLQLPNQNRQRFCQVIFDYASKNIMKLCIHEHANWQDRIRFETQQQELDMYREQLAMHQMMVMQHQLELEQKDTMVAGAITAGLLGPQGQQQAAQALAADAAMPLPPPPAAPSWMRDPSDPMEEPEPPRKEPILLFAHAVCIEPFFGSLGMSYGMIEGDINRAINTLLSQFVDSATSANINSWVVHESVEFEEEFTHAPGAINKMKGVSIDAMEKAMFPVPTRPANPQMFQLVELLSKYAESAVQAPNILSGAPGKSGETAREWSGRLEQATKQLTVVSAKLRDCVQQVLKNNAFLNSIFLPEEEVFMVTNHLMPLESERQIKIGRSMYERNYNVEIRADLRFTARAQKVQEAMEAYGFIMQNPLTMNNPIIVYYATKKIFEAWGRRDLVQMLGPPPMPPQPGAQPPAPPQPQQGQQPPGPNGPPATGQPN